MGECSIKVLSPMFFSLLSRECVEEEGHVANTEMVAVVILGRTKKSFYVLLLHLSLPKVLMIVRVKLRERERVNKVLQAEDTRSISFPGVPKFRNGIS